MPPKRKGDSPAKPAKKAKSVDPAAAAADAAAYQASEQNNMCSPMIPKVHDALSTINKRDDFKDILEKSPLRGTCGGAGGREVLAIANFRSLAAPNRFFRLVTLRVSKAGC